MVERVSPGYDQIWDCCCDHGLLGITLMFQKTAAKLHFVDIVPDLMNELEQRLHQYFPVTAEQPERWQVHCLDVAQLPIQASDGRHLVIIAGVGGDLTADLLEAIHQRNPNASIDYLLCPANRPQYPRRTLIRLGFHCIDEQLVEENRRIYEVLTVSATARQAPLVSLLGDRFWQPHTSAAQTIAATYRQRTLEHYQRAQRSGDPLAGEMVKAWQDIRVCAPDTDS